MTFHLGSPPRPKTSEKSGQELQDNVGFGAESAPSSRQMLSSIFGKKEQKVSPEPLPEASSEPKGDIEKQRSPHGLSGVGEAIGGAVSTVGGHALRGAVGMKHAGEYVAEDALGKAGKVARMGKDVTEDIALHAYEGAGALAKMSKDKMKDTIARFRGVLEDFVKRKVQAVVTRLVDRGPDLIKYLLEDPEMPGCVARAQNRVIDGMWPDIREEILWEVAVTLDGKTKLPEPTDRPMCCCIAFFRYHLYPYDKGFWGKLFDPVNLAMRLISLVPVYGVSPVFFLFVFVIIDKSDEYQLIDFILSFKGTQFITMGIIRCIQGFVQFMLCYTAKADGLDSCTEDGPGTRGSMLASSISLLVIIFTTWAAFCLLRCSVEKGRSQLKGLTHEHTGTARTKGGYISYFLWFDLLFFLFALIPPLVVLSTRDLKKIDGDDWVMAQAVYAGTIIYGLLSAPFFLFTLPGLQRVLTHAMPTAYDREGRCRKCERPPPKKDRKRESLGDGLVTEEDSASIFTQMRGLVGCS